LTNQNPPKSGGKRKDDPIRCKIAWGLLTKNAPHVGVASFRELKEKRETGADRFEMWIKRRSEKKHKEPPMKNLALFGHKGIRGTQRRKETAPFRGKVALKERRWFCNSKD